MTFPTETQGHQQPEITIPGLGKVKGVLDEEHPVAKFLSIPFGVVNERWRPADKAGPWQGVCDATKSGTRLSAPGDGPLFDQLFGVPKIEEEATKIEERLSGNCIFTCPVFLANEVIVAHPSCQLTRYHVDVRVAKTDEMAPNLKTHHGIELSYVFGNKTASALLSSEELSFREVMQGVRIDVITSKSPEETSLPKVKDIKPAPIP
ncbi:hypothetical protein BGZ68_002811, partial [Mortierella alpina]